VVLPSVSIATTRNGSELNGLTTGEGIVTVSRAGASLAAPLTVDYTVDPSSTAIAGTNYVALSGSVVIPAGRASAAIDIQVLSDPSDLTTHTVILDLTPGADYTLSALPAKQKATVTIASDAPTINIIATRNGSEYHGTTTGQGIFTVTRVGVNLAVPVTVYYTVDPASTAVAGTNYVPLSGSVVIPAGRVSAQIYVQVLPDPTDLTTTTLILDLTATGMNYKLNPVPARDTAKITIASDAPTVRIALTKNASTTNGTTTGEGIFTVTRQGLDLSQPLTVNYVVDPSSTATEGTTYAALSGHVVIQAGKASAPIDIAVNPGVVSYLSTETVVLDLVAGPTYNLNANRALLTAKMTIFNTLAADFLALLGFNAPGSTWNYNIAGSFDGRGATGTGAASVTQDSSTTWDYAFQVTPADPDVEGINTDLTWQQTAGGVFLDTVSEAAADDSVSETIHLDNGQICESVLSGTFTSTTPIEIDINGASDAASGTAKITTTLVGNSKVTVPDGAFNATQIVMTIAFSAGGSISGQNLSIHGTDTMTFYGVNGVGPVKIISAESSVATLAGRGSYDFIGAYTSLLTSVNYMAPAIAFPRAAMGAALGDDASPSPSGSNAVATSGDNSGTAPGLAPSPAAAYASPSTQAPAILVSDNLGPAQGENTDSPFVPSLTLSLIDQA